MSSWARTIGKAGFRWINTLAWGLDSVCGGIKSFSIKMIRDKKQEPELDSGFVTSHATGLKVVPGLGHSTLIRLSSLNVL